MILILAGEEHCKTFVSQSSDSMSKPFPICVKVLSLISFRKFLTPGWRSRGAATPPASTPTDSFQVVTLPDFGADDGGHYNEKFILNFWQ